MSDDVREWFLGFGSFRSLQRARVDILGENRCMTEREAKAAAIVQADYPPFRYGDLRAIELPGVPELPGKGRFMMALHGGSADAPVGRFHYPGPQTAYFYRRVE